jgi:hypothetical protein
MGLSCSRGKERESGLLFVCYVVTVPILSCTVPMPYEK